MACEKDDMWLWENIKKGDLKSLEIIFYKYYETLLILAKRYLNSDDAEEVVSDIFFVLWLKKKQIDIKKSLKGYLYKVTSNRCLNVIKKSKKRNEYFEVISDFIIEPIIQNGPEDILIYKQTKKQLESLIDELPPQCKTIFVLSRQNELSHKEISEALGISVNTVNTQIYRALKYLKKEFVPNKI